MRSIESVSGLLRLTAILGDPIARVRAPQQMNTLFDQQQRDNVLMVPMHVTAQGLAGAVNGLRHYENFAGAVITAPHKQAIISHLDKVTAAVARAGACNVIRRTPDGQLEGGLLEGDGFIEGLRRRGYCISGKRVYLAGAGFTGSAIAHALAAQGVSEIVLFNRSDEKGVLLAESLSTRHPGVVVIHGTDTPSQCDIAINATPAGEGDDSSQAFSVSALGPQTLVCDTVIYPLMTPLLTAAQQVGLATHHGEQMLDAQISLMADFMLNR